MIPESPLANRVFLASKDMGYALAYLDGQRALQKNYPDQNTMEFIQLNEAVLIATIVTYCRPFKRSRSAGFADAALNPEDIGLFDDASDLRKCHEQLLTLRDQAIAHSDWTHHSTKLLEANEHTVLRGSPRPQFLAGLKADDLRPLICHVLKFCRNKSFDLDRGAR